MNEWTEKSIEIANESNYLDQVFEVYPMAANSRRQIPKSKLNKIRDFYMNQEDINLIEELLTLKIFPVKDSYVAYLRRDSSSLERNPETVRRIAENLYAIGYDSMIERCTQPKETNRQIGPMFKSWLDKETLGAEVLTDPEQFVNSSEDVIFNGSDQKMQDLARHYLGYTHNKGIDFLAKFNDQYVVGEAKFLTDFGGHQNAQFNDAISTITSNFEEPRVNKPVHKVAILDGVLYIKSRNKMYQHLENNSDQIILSSLLLREFLHSL